jgi:hypothetical protein
LAVFHLDVDLEITVAHGLSQYLIELRKINQLVRCLGFARVDFQQIIYIVSSYLQDPGDSLPSFTHPCLPPSIFLDLLSDSRRPIKALNSTKYPQMGHWFSSAVAMMLIPSLLDHNSHDGLVSLDGMRSEVHNQTVQIGEEH